MITNIHTHQLTAAHNCQELVSVSPGDFAPKPGVRYAIGIHPWHTASVTDDQLRRLERLAFHPQVAAIGETGLDALKGGAIEGQMEIFRFHINIAQQAEKPLVIHTVRTSQQVLRAWKASQQSIPWIIHGMRGNSNVARPLIDAGFYLSFGARFNPETARATPLDRLLIETDDAPVTFEEVALKVAEALGMTQREILELATRNATSLLAGKG